MFVAPLWLASATMAVIALGFALALRAVSGFQYVAHAEESDRPEAALLQQNLDTVAMGLAGETRAWDAKIAESAILDLAETLDLMLGPQLKRLNRLGRHFLLRAASKLDIRTQVVRDPSKPCSPHLTRLFINGSLLGDMTMTLRAAEFKVAGGGSNWPFSVQVSAKPGSKHADKAFPWRAVSGIAAMTPTELTPTAMFVAVNQSEPRHLSESMALELQLGHPEAQILIYHIPNQGLGIALTKLRNLGENRFGGLLGTETTADDGPVAACSDEGKLLMKPYSSKAPASNSSGVSLIQGDTSLVHVSAFW